MRAPLGPHIVIRAVVEAHFLKMNSIHPNRSEKTLQLFGESIFLSLKVCYERLLVPEAPASMVYENFIENLRHLDQVSIENPLEILKHVIYPDGKLNDQKIARAPIGPVVLGAIFAFRAFRELEMNQSLENAWSCMADASFWSGVALTGSSMDATVIKERQQQASKAGNAQSAKRKPMRELAQELTRKEMPEGKWDSRDQAVEAIIERVNKRAKKKANRVVHDTIVGWLGEMEDKSLLFKPANRNKNRA